MTVTPADAAQPHVLTTRGVQAVPLGRIDVRDFKWYLRPALRANELTPELQRDGQQVPIVLREREVAGLQIICGFRRIAAARRLGWPSLQAVVVRHLSDRAAFAMAVLGSLDPSKPVPAFADIEQTLKDMSNSNIRDTLLAHVATAQGDIQKLRDNVAAWFDGAMDRVSGIYRQNLKGLSLLVGLAVAIVLNADSLAVGKALWNDPTLRAQITEAARNPKEPTTPSALAQATEGFEKLRPLPIGWDPHPPTFPTFAALAWFWVQKAFGLLVTGIALSLGAPFWFDLLSKIMNVRGAGGKPQRTDAPTG